MIENGDLDMTEVPAEALQPVLPGFYELFYDPGEVDDLNHNLFADLVAEICLLRAVMRRALTQAKEIQDLDASLKVLNALGLASLRLARLLEVQLKLSERSYRGSDAFAQALLEISEKLRSE